MEILTILLSIAIICSTILIIKDIRQIDEDIDEMLKDIGHLNKMIDEERRTRE